jgi:nucleoside-specific outer membrane channel protein Tsx
MRSIPTLLAAGLVAVSGAASAADFSDTYIGYRYGSGYTEPSISGDVPKHIFMLGHFSVYKYGTNFFNLDILKSIENDPAAPSRTNTNQAQELYVAYRHALSLSKTTGSKITFGPVRDVSITAGFDAGTKNTSFAPRPFKLLLGPTLNIGLPAGFLDLSLLMYEETNNNGIVGREVDFDTTWQLGAVWGVPFTLGVPAIFKGFLSITGPKGKDGFGVETETETLLRASVQWDIGTLAGLNKGTVFAGVGYEYWKNKFGNPPGTGTKTSTPTLHAEWHF